jgi:hypothetical protein
VLRNSKDILQQTKTKNQASYKKSLVSVKKPGSRYG